MPVCHAFLPPQELRMHKQIIHTPDAPGSKLYSQAVRVGPAIHVEIPNVLVSIKLTAIVSD